jgi:cytochrome c oxidase subunit III
VSITVAYAALVAGIVVWVLLARRLTAKPWESPGPPPETAGEGDAPARPSAKVGLLVLLAVITSLFGLFISAYWMRMGHAHGQGDWSPAPLPRVLWLNTVLLVLSSACMQLARSGIRRARAGNARLGLILGGILALAFLGGQLLAWHQLNESGYFVTGNAAVSFFYLLTGVHGLHLLGGLFVWGRTVARMAQSGVELIDLRLSVELCTVYWHYLLLVWLVLFGVLLWQV